MPLILPNSITNAIPADGDKLGQNFATITDYVNTEVITRDGARAMTGPLLLPGAPTQANQAATKGYVDSQGGIIGEMKMFGGDVEPANWMFCRGQAISRATYAALFAVLGTKYGAGDNSTTFNLPNLQGTHPVGFNSGVNEPSNVTGLWKVGLGERSGTATPTMPVHSHTVDIWSAQEDSDHAHGFNANTGYESANHYHGPQAGTTGIWMTVNAGGIGAAGNSSPFRFINATGTDWNSNFHYHAVNGTTYGADRHHRHAVNGNTGNSNAGSPTSGNYAPSLSVNFIMKVS